MLKKSSVFLLFACLYHVHSDLVMYVYDLKTTNTYFKIQVIAFNEKDVRISSSVSLSGDLEKSSSKEFSNFWFENLVVSEPGIIEFTAEGLNNGSKASTTIKVEAAIKIINIQCPEGIIRINEQFNFTINVTNQYGSYYSEETNFYLSNGVSEKMESTENSLFDGNVTYTQKGIYTINVIQLDRTVTSKKIKVYGNSLQIITNGVKQFTSKAPHFLEIIIDPADSNETTAVNLRLNCLTICSGTIFTTSNKDLMYLYKVNILEYMNFTLFVLSSGTFSWVATTEDNLSKTSDSFAVVNSIKAISSFFSEPSTTAYFPVNYTIEVYGDDDEFYINPVNVTINDYSGASSVKKKILKIQNGIETIEIYYMRNLNASYKITCKELSRDFIYEDVIDVYPNQLVMTKSKHWYPQNIKDSFNFKISVHNHEMNLKETSYGVYNLTINLYPDESSLSGSQVSLITINGEASINDLYIDSAGTHLLNISCDSCETYLTENFTINIETCEFGSSVIVCMSVISGFFLMLSICFCLYDFKYTGRSPHRCISVLDYVAIFHPVLTLFFFQEKLRRARNCLHLLSSELILLAIIGAMYYIFDTPESSGGNEFDGFDIKQSNIGAVAWLLQQILVFPLFILNHLSIGYEKLICISVFFEILTIISSITGIIVMSLRICRGFAENWLINFGIYSFLDLIIMKFLHAYLSHLIKVKKVRIALP